MAAKLPFVLSRALAIRLTCIGLVLLLVRSVHHDAVWYKDGPIFDKLAEKSTALQNSMSQKMQSSAPMQGRLADIMNSTLGFQKVYVIGLAARTDKRDVVTLAARMTGIDIEWIDGVIGDQIAPKSVPESFAETRWATDYKTIGCWRAHQNVAQRMVKGNIGSALIMEDDVDWDVFIKQQLTGFARGVTHLQNVAPRSGKTSARSQTSSPYGDDWDLHWLGHCGTWIKEDVDTDFYVIDDDPTAVPDVLYPRNKHVPNFTPDVFHRSNFTRVIIPPSKTWCTFGYAISLRGARRSLYQQSVGNDATAIDEALNKLCMQGSLGFTCYAPYPPLLGTHRRAGSIGGDSDRADHYDPKQRRENASTASIVYSARLNLKNLLLDQTSMQSQWPEQTMLDTLELDAVLPEGRGAFVKAGDYGRNPRDPIYGGPRFEPAW